MDKKKKLTLLLILLTAGWAGRIDAMSLGEVGQGLEVQAYDLAGYIEDATPGTISRVVAGAYSESAGGPFSWAHYDTRAQASPGVLGAYIDFSYVNGGDWYNSGARAESGDILTVYDPTHANGSVDLYFNPDVHGTLSSSGEDVYGSVAAGLRFGEFNGASWDETWTTAGQFYTETTRDGINSVIYTPLPSYTFSLALDQYGYGQMAALLYLDTYVSEGASSWSPSSGAVLADYYNTVSISVASQYGTTTITSQGGWDVGNTTAVPEPSTILLLGSGLAGFAGIGIMKRRKKG